MFDYPQFDRNGEKIIARMDGVNADMLMDITVRRLEPGESLTLFAEEKENAALLTQGSVIFEWDDAGKHYRKEASRKSVFSEAPFCLHLCRNRNATITAVTECELIIQSAINEREFPCRLYTPSENKVELMGADQWEGTAKREVLTIFDYQNAPYSNMVIGEVITKAGRWSSYIPHSHPQPEVYYYKFDKPQGFGGAFIGDNAFKVKDGSAASIPGGLTHPQTAAPGYDMYYCWMIRHLDQNPWTTRDNDPDHEWLLGI